MRNRVLFLTGLIALLALVLLACSFGGSSARRAASTPTKALPALFTSTTTPTPTPLVSDTPQPAATALPLTDLPTLTAPAALTEAPILPTGVSPTGTASLVTDTPLPPAETPLPPTMPPSGGIDPPQPLPTKTAVPPTSAPSSQVDFRVKDVVAFEDGSLTATGLHNIYFTVLDAGGAPLDGVILQDVNNSPAEQVITGNKGPGKTEFTMWAADYRFQVVGNVGGQTYTSETTHVLSVLFGHAVWDDLIRGGICADQASCEALGAIHYSYNVTFQRTW